MKTLHWLLVAAVLLIGLIFYRYRSSGDLRVTPEAREEIEKAKQR